MSLQVEPNPPENAGPEPLSSRSSSLRKEEKKHSFSKKSSSKRVLIGASSSGGSSTSRSMMSASREEEFGAAYGSEVQRKDEAYIPLETARRHVSEIHDEMVAERKKYLKALDEMQDHYEKLQKESESIFSDFVERLRQKYTNMKEKYRNMVREEHSKFENLKQSSTEEIEDLRNTITKLQQEKKTMLEEHAKEMENLQEELNDTKELQGTAAAVEFENRLKREREKAQALDGELDVWKKALEGSIRNHPVATPSKKEVIIQYVTKQETHKEEKEEKEEVEEDEDEDTTNVQQEDIATESAGASSRGEGSTSAANEGDREVGVGEIEYKRVQNELEKHQEKNKELEKRLEKLSSEKEELEGKRTKAENEMKDKLSKMQEKVDSLKSSLATSEREAKNWKENFEKVSSDYALLIGGVGGKEKSDKETELEKKRLELSEIEKDLKEANDAVNALNGQKVSLNKEIHKWCSEFEKKEGRPPGTDDKRQIQDKYAAYRSLKKKIEKAEKKQKECQEKQEKVSGEIKELEDDVKEKGGGSMSETTRPETEEGGETQLPPAAAHALLESMKLRALNTELEKKLDESKGEKSKLKNDLKGAMKKLSVTHKSNVAYRFRIGMILMNQRRTREELRGLKEGKGVVERKHDDDDDDDVAPSVVVATKTTEEHGDRSTSTEEQIAAISSLEKKLEAERKRSEKHGSELDRTQTQLTKAKDEKEQLESEVTSLRERLSNADFLEGENERLKEQLASTEAEVKRLQENGIGDDDIKNELERLRSDLRDARDDCTDARKEVSKKEGTITERDETISNLRSKLQEMEEMEVGLAREKREAQKFKKESEEKDEEIRELNKKVRSLEHAKQESERWKKENTSLQEEVERLQTASTENADEETKKMLENLQQSSSEMREQISQKEAEVEEANGKREELEQSLEASRERVKELEQEMQDMVQKAVLESSKKRVSSLETEVNELKEELRQKEQEMASMGGGEEEEGAAGGAGGAEASSSAEASQLKRKLRRATEEKEKADRALRVLKEKIHSLETENQKLKTAAAKKPESSGPSAADVARQEAQVKKLQDDIIVLNKKVDDGRKAQVELAKANKKIQQLETKVKQLSARSAGASGAEIQKYKDTIAKMQADIDKGKSYAEDLRNARQELEKEKKQSKKMEVELKKALNSGQSGVEAMKKEMENEMKQMERKCELSIAEVNRTKEAEIQKMNEKHSRLEADYKKKSSVLQKAEEEIGQLTKEVEKLSRESGSQSKEVERLNVLVAEGEEAKKKLAETEKELSEAKKERTKMEKLYKDEVVLRKKLHNEIEDMKGKIRVFCRVRPLIGNELVRNDQFSVEFPDECTIRLPTKEREFVYDHVFTPSDSQDLVFEDTKHLIQSAIDGFNVCVFAYGQTGSGKTYTIAGDEKNPGVVPRAMQELFRILEDQKEVLEVTLKCYMVELYLDVLYDLFRDPKKAGKQPKLEIRRDAKGTVFIPNTTLVTVTSLKQMTEVYFHASRNRHTRSHAMNADSSRSHLVFATIIETYNLKTQARASGKMSLVDLAGSERLEKTQVTDRIAIDEARSINVSLLALQEVISKLVSDPSGHVPYRNNTLTLLMSDSLGGNAKTLMFVNVSPSNYNTMETITSLQYASRVKLITNDAKKQEESKEMARLKGIIMKLRAGLDVGDEVEVLDIDTDEAALVPEPED